MKWVPMQLDLQWYYLHNRWMNALLFHRSTLGWKISTCLSSPVPLVGRSHPKTNLTNSIDWHIVHGFGLLIKIGITMYIMLIPNCKRWSDLWCDMLLIRLWYDISKHSRKNMILYIVYPDMYGWNKTSGKQQRVSKFSWIPGVKIVWRQQQRQKLNRKQYNNFKYPFHCTQYWYILNLNLTLK